MFIQYNFRSLMNNTGGGLHICDCFRQIANVPDQYTVQHFRCQVVKNMSVTRESLLTILSPLLQDKNRPFKEVMEEIRRCNLRMNIHNALTCIRLFLCIPIILLKPSWKKFQESQRNTIYWNGTQLHLTNKNL